MTRDYMISFNDDKTCSFLEPIYKLHCNVITCYHPPSPNHKVALVGNVPALGCWNTDQAVVAKNIGNDQYNASFDIAQGIIISFKWIILDEDGQINRWEECNDKIIHVPRLMAGSFQVESLWCEQAKIINVVDRYGRTCCVDEAIRFANVELATLMDENAERIRELERVKQIDTKMSNRFAKVELSTLMDDNAQRISELEKVKQMDTKVSNSTSAMHKHRAMSSWQRQMALAIGGLSGVAIGGTAIYMASFTEPEPEPTMAELTFGYIQNIAMSVYEAATNMIFDAPEPEPTTTEQFVATVSTVCASMVNGINSLLGDFL